MLISTHWKHLWRFSTRKNSCKKNSSSTSVYFHFAALILKTSKMSICVWKHLRKTITSTTENNFHQVHRGLEEKLFKLQFVDKKELRCFETSGAWTFDPSTFFLSNAGLRKFSENRHFKKKTSLSSHHRRQPLKSTLRKFVQHFDT